MEETSTAKSDMRRSARIIWRGLREGFSKFFTKVMRAISIGLTLKPSSGRGLSEGHETIRQNLLVTRRTLLSAASATAICGSKPILPEDSGKDEDLFSLRATWQEAQAAFLEVLKAKTPIEARCFLGPRYPERSTFASDAAHHAARECCSYVRAVTDLEERLAEIERLEDLAGQAAHEVLDQILAIPARTIEGIIVKAEISKACEHHNEELTHSTMEDLLVWWARRNSRDARS